MPQSSAKSRHDRRVFGLSLAYAAALIAAEALLKHRLVGGAGAYLVAVLPALPIVGMFAAIGRYLVEERDEYIRMLAVRQVLIACGLALSVATMWGFMEGFGLVGHVELYAVAMLWFVGLGLGAFVNRVWP